jgi:hypothetical protein
MGDAQLRTERRGHARPDPEVPRPLWSGRVVALVLGLPLLVLFGIVAMNLLDRREISSSTIAGPVDRVVVQVARGDVELVPAPAGTADVVVESTLRWRFIRPEAAVRSAGSDVAQLSGSCPRVVIVLGTCAVDYLIQVPSATEVFVRTDAGTVVVEGLDGTVRIVTDGGAVAASDMHSQRVIVESDGGAVDLAFANSPADVDVTSSGGAVTLVVPDGAPYDVRTPRTTGPVDISVTTDREAERRIRVEGGDGSVRISST